MILIKKMKKTLLILIVLVSLAPFSAKAQTVENLKQQISILRQIITLQIQINEFQKPKVFGAIKTSIVEKNIDGSYKQKLNDGSYKIDVYEAPDKQYGYQKIEYLPDGTVVSTGYGVEAKERTYTYKIEPFISSTSTPQ